MSLWLLDLRSALQYPAHSVELSQELNLWATVR